MDLREAIQYFTSDFAADLIGLTNLIGGILYRSGQGKGSTSVWFVEMLRQVADGNGRFKREDVAKLIGRFSSCSFGLGDLFDKECFPGGP